MRRRELPWAKRRLERERRLASSLEYLVAALASIDHPAADKVEVFKYPGERDRYSVVLRSRDRELTRDEEREFFVQVGYVPAPISVWPIDLAELSHLTADEAVKAMTFAGAFIYMTPESKARREDQTTAEREAFWKQRAAHRSSLDSPDD
jgi:hypothetical protein